MLRVVSYPRRLQNQLGPLSTEYETQDYRHFSLINTAWLVGKAAEEIGRRVPVVVAVCLPPLSPSRAPLGARGARVPISTPRRPKVSGQGRRRRSPLRLAAAPFVGDCDALDRTRVALLARRPPLHRCCLSAGERS